MRRIFISCLLLTLPFVAYCQDDQRPQLKLHSFKESISAHGMDNLGTHFIDDWPKDENGDKDCAWIRIRFENMPLSDAEDVHFSFGPSAGIRKVDNRLDSVEHEVWLFVTATDNAIMEASHPKYGASNRLVPNKLKPKCAYDVVLENGKTLSISINTIPAGAVARLEDGRGGKTPITFTDVTLGKHELTLFSSNGKMVKKDTIEVTDNNVQFQYDLRPEKDITFTSDPTGAKLYINDKYVGKTPYTVKMKYDSYNVKAELGPNETDSRSITVSEYSEKTIHLEPIEKKTFEVYAIYDGRKVDADLYIDGEREGTNKPSYTLTKPIGKSYEMKMIHYGDSKKRKIKVTRKMGVEQEFKISARNSFVWPWQREYEPCPVGLSLGYVSKQLVTTGEGEKLKEDGVWDDGEGKSLHGFQFGLHFQPCFSFGLGFYSGLFYECYMSWNNDYEYDEFFEHCLYMPIHGYLRLPFAKRVALSLHGGIGLNYVIHGAYSDTDSYYDDYTDFYGDPAFPQRFNLTGEIGLGVRIGPVQINGQYAKGLIDHKSYESLGDYKTVQNKLSISISYVFSGE